MTERGIIFSAPMVRALLAGAKTQTRRLAFVGDWKVSGDAEPGDRTVKRRRNPLCNLTPGDRLWVRETHTTYNNGSRAVPAIKVLYATDFEGFEKPDRDWDWTPALHMPRTASRITLELSAVRTEPLQAISEIDAQAEGVEQISARGPDWRDYSPMMKGCEALTTETARESYRSLWDALHGAGSWTANPEVVVLTFKRLP